MGVTLLVLLCLLIPMANFLHSSAHDNTINELEKNGFILGGRSVAVLTQPTEENTAALRDVAKKYSERSGARVIITDSRGIAVVTTDADDSKLGSSYASRPEVASALGGTVATGERFSRSLGTDLLYVAVPVMSGPSVLGAVRITYPDAEVESRISAQVSLLWIVGFSALALAALVGLILAKTVNSPLERLTRTAANISDGDLDQRSRVRRGAVEIRQLSEAFDRMADRLSELLEEQRRFAADASHQLRTPLTALRLRLESARTLLRDDAERAEQRIEAAEAEAERLQDLVESLLLLSRGELGLGSRISVDATAAVNAVIESWLPLAEESGVTVRPAIAADVSVLALDQAIEQVVGNLLDNAIKACTSGGHVAVTLTSNESWATLSIVDDGIGLSAEECRAAFERFWRADGAQSGTGIGLTVVHRLVAASGGDVWLEPNLPNGVRAIVRLPRIPGAVLPERG